MSRTRGQSEIRALADPPAAKNPESLSLATGHCPRTTGFLRWLKFNAVGGIGILVQLAALAVFRSLCHLNYLLATALAVETAVLHNFFWHERFTWADRPSGHVTQSLMRLARFNATNGLVSIVGNLLLMRVLAGAFGLHYFIANLIAIAVCSLANFLLSDFFVFRGPAGALKSTPGSMMVTPADNRQ